MTLTSDSLCLTDEPTIDAHHRHLAGLIDRAVEALTQGEVKTEDAEKLIASIELYANTHFAYEESIIDRICPAFVSNVNREGHAFFKARLRNLREMQGHEPASSTFISSLTLLRDWFNGHICDVDCRLREFINRHD